MPLSCYQDCELVIISLMTSHEPTNSGSGGMVYRIQQKVNSLGMRLSNKLTTESHVKKQLGG